MLTPSTLMTNGHIYATSVRSQMISSGKLLWWSLAKSMLNRQIWKKRYTKRWMKRNILNRCTAIPKPSLSRAMYNVPNAKCLDLIHLLMNAWIAALFLKRLWILVRDQRTMSIKSASFAYFIVFLKEGVIGRSAPLSRLSLFANNVIPQPFLGKIYAQNVRNR